MRLGDPKRPTTCHHCTGDVGPSLAVGADGRRDVLPEHRPESDIGWPSEFGPDASDPVQEIRGEVGDLDTRVGLGADEVDGVDDVRRD